MLAFEGLNPQQIEAVRTLKGPLLVLAGAGSGKTRVLTHRILNLIEEGLAFPGEILSLTFTNKAAGEMRERVRKMLTGSSDIPVDDIWLSTFHSMGARLLRENAHRVGLEASFSIFDSSDQKTLIKQCMEELEISDKVLSPKSVAWKLESLKNDGVDPINYEGDGSFYEKKTAPLIRHYQKKLRALNSVDFGDLLLLTYHLFRDNEDFCDKFQDRYKFVLVD